MTVTTATAVELRGVDAGYEDTAVLRHLDLRVERGSTVALLGPNGAGKTTTLNTISGLVRPTAGSVHLDDTDITRLAPHQRQRAGICHVPEGRSVFPSLTVRENLLLLAPRSADPDAALEGAVHAFAALGRRLDAAAGTLSGGERQQLAIARAFVSTPTVVVLDEVSLGLAPVIIDEIYESLQLMRSSGVTIVLVEQFVDRALALADRVLVMARGSVVLDAPAGTVDREAIAHAYLGGTPT